MSHIHQSGTRMNTSCYLFEYIMSNIGIRHVKYLNTSCSIFEYVMSHLTASCRRCLTLQHTKCSICITLKYAAARCSTLQHAVTHCSTLQHTCRCGSCTNVSRLAPTLQHPATHCNTLQHTATHCNICYTLQRTTTRWHTLQRTATHDTYVVVSRCGDGDSCRNISNTLQHTATHCDTLQHTATHCNTLQHTVTHCNKWHICPTFQVRGWRQSHKYFETPTHRQRLIAAFSLPPHFETAAQIRYRQLIAGKAKEPYISALKSYISAKEPYTNISGHTHTANVSSCKRDLYFCKRGLYLCKRALHNMYIRKIFRDTHIPPTPHCRILSPSALCR